MSSFVFQDEGHVRSSGYPSASARKVSMCLIVITDDII